MKLKSFSLALVFLLVTTSFLPAEESWITSGNWTYQVNADGGATLGDYLGSGSDVVIPSSIDDKTVTAIGDYVFEGNYSIRTITIPDTVTSIGEGAFYMCESLGSITIPEGVSDIETYTFYGCGSLTAVNLPQSLQTIKSGAFAYCVILPSITIPENTTTIGYTAFSHCDFITSIEIPDKVTTIGHRVFAGCSNLYYARFYGNAPTTFGDEVFSDTSPAFSIHYYQGKTGWTTPTWNGYQTLELAAQNPSPEEEDPETAPAISQNPLSQTVDLYQSVTFSVTATGSSPLSYQWFKNGAAISGATSSSYTIASVGENNAGDYYCQVSNNAGGTNSETATLSVTSYNKVPLYRFSRNDNPSHFFTAVEEEKNIVLSELGDYFTLEGVSHYVVAQQKLTTVPVYRMYNNLSGAHFYTASEIEMQNVLATLDYFSLEGVAFYVFLWPEQGTLPVYRFYVPETGSHFFTINEGEKNALVNSGQQTMVYEGIAWYAFPNP